MKLEPMVYHDNRIKPVRIADGIYRKMPYYVLNFGTHPCAYVDTAHQNTGCHSRNRRRKEAMEMGWIKCSKEAFEKCSYKGKCGRFDDAFFMDESVCDEFNQSIKSCIVDAVPVVRCRDCKYLYTDEYGFLACAESGAMLAPEDDDYCSRGQRRDQFAGAGKTGGQNDADQH